MKSQKRTQTADLFTEIVLETFQLNGRIIEAGDNLTNDLGLTSALWQVLGAVRESPLSMAQIARKMGLSRQGIRRSVKILLEKGFVGFKENPDHKRAQLVTLTTEGTEVLNRISKIQIGWANAVSEGLSTAELKKVIRTMKVLKDRL